MRAILKKAAAQAQVLLMLTQGLSLLDSVEIAGFRVTRKI